MEKVCIVHDRKYLSKFHGSVNQLRRLNEFNLSILQQLPKRCCSCGGKDGESSFTIDHLRELCREIQSSSNGSEVKSSPPPPVKTMHCVVLEYSPMLSLLQRVYKGGRFVGRNGKHLQLLQRTLNIRINILNQKSSRNFRQMVNEFQKQDSAARVNNLWLLITLNDDNDDLEKIQQSLKDSWEDIDVKKKFRITSSAPLVPPSTSISSDARWKPKKNKAKEKYKSKLSQWDEPEVPAQPFIPPISMPKEIDKHRKNKRK